MVVRTAGDLGVLIRARRRELGLDQQTLATRIGASRLWVIEFEKGKPRAEIGLVLRALMALDLRVDVAVENAKMATTSRVSMPPAPPDIDAVVRRARKGG
jgi:HTH-type transcriptional regulator/antitoxin HipB